jgi:hypothetical protein
MRTYRFQFEITCVGDGTADLARVEEMIDLSMQELVYDDEFANALNEDTAITIQVTQIGGTNG